MTRKPLPKAITRPLEGRRPGSADILLDDEAPAPRRPPAREPIEPELKISASPAANDATPAAADTAASPQAQKFVAKRRALAKKIVERHRNMAAVGGLVPLPVANIAGVTAINLRMVKKLSDLYQVPFQRDRTRALIVSLVGGAVPTGIGTATSTTLMWIIPGGLLVGLGAAAVSAAALTRGIGLVFIESFESGAGIPGA